MIHLEKSLLSSWTWDPFQIVIWRLPGVSVDFSEKLSKDLWAQKKKKRSVGCKGRLSHLDLLQQYHQIVLSGPFCGLPIAMVVLSL